MVMDLSPVIPLLELAKAGIPLVDLPPNLQDALTFCTCGENKLVDITRPNLEGWTAGKTKVKKAQDLRDNDIIQWPPGDNQGFTIEKVIVNTHTVEVEGSGKPHTWKYGANVEVFEGPLPQPIYSERKLFLLPEGQKALAAHALKIKQTAVAIEGRAEALASMANESPNIGTGPESSVEPPRETKSLIGPKPPHWLSWVVNGVYQKIPIGKRKFNLSWRLLQFFWPEGIKDVPYEDLQGPGKPWSCPVSDSAIASAVNRFNNEFWPRDFPWTLVCEDRTVKKIPRGGKIPIAIPLVN